MSLPRSFASVACALASLGTAHAEWQALAFTFEPLACTFYNHFPLEPPRDCGQASLSGMFAYDDADDDGHIVRGELLELRVGGIEFPFTSGFGASRVDSFDYAPQTGLHFSMTSDTGRVHFSTGSGYRWDSRTSSHVDAWTPATRTRVYAMPEPGSFWLVLAGAAALAWRYARRRLERPAVAAPDSRPAGGPIARPGSTASGRRGTCLV